ncbi:hypothetical protein Patl1_18177 [Pistacia atlantica]|uniref:Uncharacterized protein n=1 Tax=Pistacia atlantica TaxID=434234 RepID=A0ACC1C323_9ROSI|nr:hypothetical protein Patl1_18177 [Pistacia atlantica]
MPPVSTIASEITFSAGGHVLDERRSSLHLSIVEALMCMKDWVAANFKLQNRVVKDIFEDFNNLEINDNEDV